MYPVALRVAGVLAMVTMDKFVQMVTTAVDTEYFQLNKENARAMQGIMA